MQKYDEKQLSGKEKLRKRVSKKEKEFKPIPGIEPEKIAGNDPYLYAVPGQILPKIPEKDPLRLQVQAIFDKHPREEEEFYKSLGIEGDPEKYDLTPENCEEIIKKLEEFEKVKKLEEIQALKTEVKGITVSLDKAIRELEECEFRQPLKAYVSVADALKRIKFLNEFQAEFGFKNPSDIPRELQRSKMIMDHPYDEKRLNRYKEDFKKCSEEFAALKRRIETVPGELEAQIKNYPVIKYKTIKANLEALANPKALTSSKSDENEVKREDRKVISAKSRALGALEDLVARLNMIRTELHKVPGTHRKRQGYEDRLNEQLNLIEKHKSDIAKEDWYEKNIRNKKGKEEDWFLFNIQISLKYRALNELSEEIENTAKTTARIRFFGNGAVANGIPGLGDLALYGVTKDKTHLKAAAASGFTAASFIGAALASKYWAHNQIGTLGHSNGLLAQSSDIENLDGIVGYIAIALLACALVRQVVLARSKQEDLIQNKEGVGSDNEENLEEVEDYMALKGEEPKKGERTLDIF